MYFLYSPESNINNDYIAFSFTIIVYILPRTEKRDALPVGNASRSLAILKFFQENVAVLYKRLIYFSVLSRIFSDSDTTLHG